MCCKESQPVVDSRGTVIWLSGLTARQEYSPQIRTHSHDQGDMAMVQVEKVYRKLPWSIGVTTVCIWLAACLFHSSALGQSLLVRDVNLNTVAQNSIVYSNPSTNQWPMPLLYISVPGANSCASVSLTLTVQFTDLAGKG